MTFDRELDPKTWAMEKKAMQARIDILEENVKHAQDKQRIYYAQFFEEKRLKGAAEREVEELKKKYESGG